MNNAVDIVPPIGGKMIIKIDAIILNRSNIESFGMLNINCCLTIWMLLKLKKALKFLNQKRI